MYIHWNEAPHRFGLFGEGGQVRPQYFVYQMLSRMGEERLACAIEQRTVDVQPDFSYQFYCPADSVLRVTLEDLE